MVVAWQCWGMVGLHDLGRLFQPKQCCGSMDKAPHAALWHRVRVTMLQSVPKSSAGCSQRNSTAKPNRATLLSPLLPLPPFSPFQNSPFPLHLLQPSPQGSQEMICRPLAQVGAVKFPTWSLSGHSSCPQPTTQIQGCLHGGRIRTFESKSHLQGLFGKLDFIIYWIWLERARKMSSHRRYLCSPSAA